LISTSTGRPKHERIAPVSPAALQRQALTVDQDPVAFDGGRQFDEEFGIAIEMVHLGRFAPGEGGRHDGGNACGELARRAITSDFPKLCQVRKSKIFCFRSHANQRHNSARLTRLRGVGHRHDAR